MFLIAFQFLFRYDSIEYHASGTSLTCITDGLLELRIKSKEGIARVFYCTVINKRIVMLHVFIKKSQKIPQKELMIALARLKEVKENETR
jgi:phage-related protein